MIFDTELSFLSDLTVSESGDSESEERFKSWLITLLSDCDCFGFSGDLDCI